MTSPVRTARLTDEQQSAVLALVAAAQERRRGRRRCPSSRCSPRADAPDGPSSTSSRMRTTTSSATSRSTRGRRPRPPSSSWRPSHRRQGVGSELLSRIRPGTRIWAHGDLAAVGRVRGGARAGGGPRAVRPGPPVRRGRARSTSRSCPTVSWPRPFRPGRDEEEWLRVNAAAFAHHAEQGRMTRADLDARMDESVVRPRGAHPRRPRGRPRHGGRLPLDEDDIQRPRVRSTSSRSTPHTRARVWAGPVTLLGLRVPAPGGVEDVILYVDGDNPAALKVYRGLGFTTRSVDRMFAARAQYVDASSPRGGTMRS